MADNVAITPGSGATIAADEIGGVKYQRVKLVHGADGANAGDVSSDNPFPVSTITGFATSAKQDDLKIVAEATRDRIGATDEAAAGTDSATSGLNGLFKRFLGRFTTLLDRLPSALVGGRLDVNVGNTITETNSASINGKLPALAGGKLDIRPLAGNTDTVAVSGTIPVSGTFWQGTQPVSLTSLPTLAAGTNNIGDVDIVGGTIADDAVSSANPLLLGAVAVETDGTDPTSVSAEGDLAYLRTTRDRRLLVRKSSARGWKGNENHASAQTNNQLVAAPGAGLSLYVTDIIISVGSTAGSVKLVEDTAGTPADVAGPYYFAANGGCHLALEQEIKLTANKDLGFTSATVGNHTVTVLGYTAP